MNHDTKQCELWCKWWEYEGSSDWLRCIYKSQSGNFLDIIIAEGCYIGVNAVVNKIFLEPNSVIAGVPVKVIKYDSIYWWEKNHLLQKK